MENQEAPFFSIVIVNYNYGRFLEAAILSILNQSCVDYELIVVDGGSTDNSVEIIRKYQNSISWWCSEKDSGQSHAFNKGFAKAKGDFLTWLNADDLLMPGTLSAAKTKLLKNPDAKWMTGNFFRFDPGGKVVECKWGPWGMPRLLQGCHAPIAVFGPTSFFSRELYQLVGGIDESLHYVMDTDLWIRFMAIGASYVRLNHYCWAFRMHEMSKTAGYRERPLPQATVDKLEEEIGKIFKKSSYVCSKKKHVMQLLLRFLSLSELKSVYMGRKWYGRSVDDFIKANCKL